jgi:hypothetical protein
MKRLQLANVAVLLEPRQRVRADRRRRLEHASSDDGG